MTLSWGGVGGGVLSLNWGVYTPWGCVNISLVSCILYNIIARGRRDVTSLPRRGQSFKLYS